MKFRPCIDIHNGKVKQIVGGSLSDIGDYAEENFIATQDAAWYARAYKDAGLFGGHVILLNRKDSEYYDETKKQAKMALDAYNGGLMVGGGITSSNASEFIDAGASHCIVTSYVFKDGRIFYDRIDELIKAIGANRLCLDLSCRKKDNKYYVVTDRWQTFTDEVVSEELLSRLSSLCDEFLIHAVDVEGKKQGVEEELISLLSKSCDRPITYAGGVGSFDDLNKLKTLGNNKIDVTIGSALDLFGGTMEFSKVIDYMK